MTEFFRKIHSDNFRWNDSLPVVFFLTFMLNVLGSLLGEQISFFMLSPFKSDLADTLQYYLWFIGIWVVFLLYFSTGANRFMFGIIGKGMQGNRLRNIIVGLFFGYLMNTLCVAVAVYHGDIHIYFEGTEILGLVILFLAVFMQSAAEELMYRGFMYQRLRRGYRNPAVAIMGNSLFFAGVHIFNPGVSFQAIMNITLMGIFFSLLVYYFDSLWMAMAAHTAWNYTQNIVFGLPNSGLVSKFSLFKLDAASARTSFAYDVNFGIEATTLAACVTVFICAVIIFTCRRDRMM